MKDWSASNPIKTFSINLDKDLYNVILLLERTIELTFFIYDKSRYNLVYKFPRILANYMKIFRLSISFAVELHLFNIICIALYYATTLCLFHWINDFTFI